MSLRSVSRPLAGLAALLIGLMVPIGAAAQSTGALTGRIIDASTDDPLQGATVAVWTETPSDSSLVTGTTTGPDGRFRLTDVPQQEYTLRVSYVGYENQRLPGTAPAADGRNLGTIRLSPVATRAGEVEVTADRPAARMEMDRSVYNTSNRAVSAGGSARTVLETLPSIRIDADGSISFRGSESVQLHINGEPASLSGESLLGYLQSLPADAVQSVEIIPNPSAKYEPEGTAGIINVVLKRDINAGWNGGVTLGAERDAYGRYGGNGSANVGYQGGGWRVVSTYSHRRESEEDTDSELLERFNENGPSTWIDQDGYEEEQELSHSFNTRVNYSAFENTTFGLDASVSLRRDEEWGRTVEREFLGPRTSANLEDEYIRILDNSSGDESFNGRLSMSHDFADDHSLDVEARYDRDLEGEDGTYTNYGIQGQNARGDQLAPAEVDEVTEDEQDGSLEVDYVRSLGPLSLETGYKGTLRRLDSEQTFEGDLDAFTFDEQIHAAYGILSQSWGDFGTQVGLRAEAVNTIIDRRSDDEVESSYTSLYPSIFFTYEPNQRRQARLSYSKRVDRPNLWDINPIEDNENPTFRERGNPNLDPEYIHSFEFTATQRWNVASVTLTPYVRHTVNEIEEVEREETVDGRTVTVRQAQNLSSSTSYGAELVTTLNVGDRVEATLNGNFYQVNTDGSNVSSDLANNSFTFSTYGNLRLQVRDGLRLEASQYYRPAHDIPGGRISSFSGTEMALRQEVLSGDGSLTFRVEDVFNATEVNVSRRTSNFYQQSTSQWGAREFSLTFQYTFGSGGGGDRDRGRRDYD